MPESKPEHYFYLMEEQQRQYILSLLAYVVQRGVAAKHICRLSNIDLDRLKKGPSKLSSKQFDDLWINASRLCNDPLIGLHFGESLQLAALGVVGEIIKTSETVGQAIAVAASFVQTSTDVFSMNVLKSARTFRIHLKVSPGRVSEFSERQLADMLLVFSLHELNGLLLEKIKPKAVVYPYRIRDKREYERIFRYAEIKIGNTYAIEFDNRYWDEPILTANYELQKLLIDTFHAKQKEKLVLSQEMKPRVLDYLMANSYLGVSSLGTVAANFSLTTRSLQRKLQKEGTTFQQLSDSVKKSLAIQFLTQNHPVQEVSDMLGYNEMSAFSRAFKRWTGKAPINY